MIRPTNEAGFISGPGLVAAVVIAPLLYHGLTHMGERPSLLGSNAIIANAKAQARIAIRGMDTETQVRTAFVSPLEFETPAFEGGKGFLRASESLFNGPKDVTLGSECLADELDGLEVSPSTDGDTFVVTGADGTRLTVYADLSPVDRQSRDTLRKNKCDIGGLAIKVTDMPITLLGDGQRTWYEENTYNYVIPAQLDAHAG